MGNLFWLLLSIKRERSIMLPPPPKEEKQVADKVNRLPPWHCALPTLQPLQELRGKDLGGVPTEQHCHTLSNLWTYGWSDSCTAVSCNCCTRWREQNGQLLETALLGSVKKKPQGETFCPKGSASPRSYLRGPSSSLSGRGTASPGCSWGGRGGGSR